MRIMGFFANIENAARTNGTMSSGRTSITPERFNKGFTGDPGNRGSGQAEGKPLGVSKGFIACRR
jgi:hypothetical protein